MVSGKIKAILKILTTRSFHLIYFAEDEPVSIANGSGTLEDLCLLAALMKQSYENFMELVTEAAAEEGELHLLDELKKTIEGSNVGN